MFVLQAELRSTLSQVEADKTILVDKVKAAEVGWLLLVAGHSSQACHTCLAAVSSSAACALCWAHTCTTLSVVPCACCGECIGASGEADRATRGGPAGQADSGGCAHQPESGRMHADARVQLWRL